ncbi:MAG: polysaccharide biosynthesis C-terminal domain-containing protein [Leptospirales bacterium]|nr:polysaccharide biosynthesis C-terminal domain-containing protein [Leptospirales bacterium]
MSRAAFVFAGRTINPLVAIIFSLASTRLLTIEEAGIYSWALARIFVVQAFAEAGLQLSLVRFLAPAVQRGDQRVVRAILRASAALKIAAFVFAAALALLYTGGVALSSYVSVPGMAFELMAASHPDRIALAWLILLGGAGLGLLTYLDSILVAHEFYSRLSLWLPVVGLLRIFLLAALVVGDGGNLRAEHLLYAFALGPYLASFAFFFFFPADHFLGAPPAAEWRPWILQLLRFNVWTLAAAFLAILAEWMEPLIITRASDNGLFGAARMPLQGFLILLATLSTMLLPRLARLQSADEYRTFFLRFYPWLAAAAVLFLPGFWIVPWFILWWNGPDYLQSVTVFYILFPNFILRIYFAPLGVALFALNQPRLIAIEAGLRMFGGLVFNLILYREFGIQGAAWASLLGQACGWLFLLFCYRQFFLSGRFPFAPTGEARNIV